MKYLDFFLFLITLIIAIVLIYFNINTKQKENFEVNIEKPIPKKNKYIYLFYANWCRYSKMIMPIWEYVSNKYKDNNEIVFKKVNVDEEKEFAVLHEISKLPTIKDDKNNIFPISFSKTNETLEKELMQFVEK